MAEAIRMPLLSDTMKEGVIAAWHKKVGDTVKSDDVIADVETDKATMEVMPYVDGTLLYIGIEQGKAAKINEIIAIVGKPGEDYKSLLDGGGEDGTTAGIADGKAKSDEKVADDQAQQNAQKEKAKPALEDTPKEEQKPTGNDGGDARPAASPKPGDATVVRMPLLSDTMKEGKIIAWHKKVGDTVKSDDVMAEVETDKATMEVMPYADGTLLYIGVEEGAAAAVNAIIAIVGKAGTDVKPYLDGNGAQDVPAAPAAQDAAPQAQLEGDKQPQQPADKPQLQGEDSKESGAENDERVKASPLARRMAEEKGIPLAELQGSGDGGRIIKRDVDEYKPKPQERPKPQATAQQQQAQQQTSGGKPAAQVQPFTTLGEEGHTDQPLSQMRRVIAQRLSESMFSAPHFYLRMTVTMDQAMEARKKINDVSPVKVSFNDLIIKAVAMALRKHPEVNSSWMGDFIRANQHVHIGVAVAIDEGLIVPVVKFADQKSLSQISQEAGTLVEKAKTKKLQPAEFSGNTFTISNLGMMDIDEFTAIINPPDACILAVGKIAPTPVVENGQVVVRNLLKLTLSCDHRVVDGAVGARFLQTLKAHLENPVTMLV